MSWEKTPTLLIQPPRLVLTDTSGATVTIRSPTPATSASRVSTRPNASWLDTRPDDTTFDAVVGMGSRGRGVEGTLLIREPTSAHRASAAEPGSNRSHSVASVNPVAARRASICASDSSAEWLSGSPAIGNP